MFLGKQLLKAFIVIPLKTPTFSKRYNMKKSYVYITCLIVFLLAIVAIVVKYNHNENEKENRCGYE
jgi:hypothetical protein